MRKLMIGVALILKTMTGAHAQTAYPNAIFVNNYSNFGSHPPSDFRPSVDAGGTRIVFERMDFNYGTMSYGPPRLYVSDIRYHQIQPLFNGVAARADWCWRRTAQSDGLISFSTENGIYVVDPDLAGSLRRLNNTTGFFYPAWYSNCQRLAIKQAVGVNGGPSALTINARTGAVEQRLSGNKTWAGFVSPSPTNQNIVIFAGQPVGATTYNENTNYVYKANSDFNPPRVTPLDPRTPPGSFDSRFQGRAPTFSPDGNWVAFESNRGCLTAPYIGNYALFIQDSRGLIAAKQVTNCSYNAQHARWMPQVPGTNQTVLIAAAYQPNVSPPAFGVATFDISAFFGR